MNSDCIPVNMIFYIVGDPGSVSLGEGGSEKGDTNVQPQGRGVIRYMTYMGMCSWTGHGFSPFCPKQGTEFNVSLS